MLTGRQKIEAAFSLEGSREFAATVCWEDVFVRDHWDQLTASPWYDQYSPDLERQMAWRRKALARTGQDLLLVPSFYSRQERAHLTIADQPEGVFLIDQANGTRKKLEPPVLGGWSRSGQLESVRTARLPTTPEELEAAVALPAPTDTERHRTNSYGRPRRPGPCLDSGSPTVSYNVYRRAPVVFIRIVGV